MIKLEKVSIVESILTAPFLILVVVVALLGRICGLVYRLIKRVSK